MIEVLKHGKEFKERHFKSCNSCNCEFIFTDEDVKSEYFDNKNSDNRYLNISNSISLSDNYVIKTVVCPECHKQIVLGVELVKT